MCRRTYKKKSRRIFGEKHPATIPKQKPRHRKTKKSLCGSDRKGIFHTYIYISTPTPSYCSLYTFLQAAKQHSHQQTQLLPSPTYPVHYIPVLIQARQNLHTTLLLPHKPSCLRLARLKSRQEYPTRQQHPSPQQKKPQKQNGYYHVSPTHNHSNIYTAHPLHHPV